MLKFLKIPFYRLSAYAILPALLIQNQAFAERTFLQGSLSQRTQKPANEQLLESQEKASLALIKLAFSDFIKIYGCTLNATHAYTRWNEFDSTRTSLFNLSGSIFALMPWNNGEYLSSFTLNAARLNGDAELSLPMFLSGLTWNTSPQWRWKLLGGINSDTKAKRPVFLTAGLSWIPNQHFELHTLLPVYVTAKFPSQNDASRYEIYLSALETTKFPFHKPELNPTFNKDALFRKTGVKLGARKVTTIDRIELSAGGGITSSQKTNVFSNLNDLQQCTLQRALFVEFGLKFPTLKDTASRTTAPENEINEIQEAQDIL